MRYIKLIRIYCTLTKDWWDVAFTCADRSVRVEGGAHVRLCAAVVLGVTVLPAVAPELDERTVQDDGARVSVLCRLDQARLCVVTTFLRKGVQMLNLGI